MSNIGFHTKGDKESITSRVDQIHTITIYCPLQDMYTRSLKDTMKVILPFYNTEANTWTGVPSIDALNAVAVTKSYADFVDIDLDESVMGIIIGSLRMFSGLKYINFRFTNDEDVMEAYSKFINKDFEGVKKYIYRIEMVEINLSNMFSQDVIDMINKVLMINGIIQNSYLNRRFILDFEYDDYMSFINMFARNNADTLGSMDENIFEYLTKFPRLMDEQKPEVRMVTNYSDR